MILTNTVFLSIVYYDMPDSLNTTLYYGNMVFTCIFAFEMLLKLLGLGIKNYVKEPFNDFDAIVVLIGLLEFIKI